MKRSHISILPLLAVALAGAACTQVYAVQYDDVNSLAFDATGKQLHEPFTTDDLANIRKKLRYARRGDLERMIERTEAVVKAGTIDAGIPDDQKEHVLRNLDLVLKQVLIPHLEQRSFEAKRRILWDSFER